MRFQDSRKRHQQTPILVEFGIKLKALNLVTWWPFHVSDIFKQWDMYQLYMVFAK